MAKKKIQNSVEEMLAEYLPAHDLELFSTEYVKEGKQRVLRVYIDKPPAEDGSDRYVGVEECEAVSRYLSDRLDETDILDENYNLEVSSPGLDRPLIHDSDYTRYAGRPVDVKLYRARDGRKQFEAELIGLTDDGAVRLRDESGEFDIPREEISTIRLAVIF